MTNTACPIPLYNKADWDSMGRDERSLVLTLILMQGYTYSGLAEEQIQC